MSGEYDNTKSPMIRLSRKKMSNDYDMERVKSAGEEINVHEELSYCSTPKDSARFYASKPYGTESKPHLLTQFVVERFEKALKNRKLLKTLQEIAEGKQKKVQNIVQIDNKKRWEDHRIRRNIKHQKTIELSNEKLSKRISEA